MSELSDRRKLEKLEGLQECSCCGLDDLSPEAVDVYDGEVICIDCLATYHSDVYRFRSGDMES